MGRRKSEWRWSAVARSRRKLQHWDYDPATAPAYLRPPESSSVVFDPTLQRARDLLLED